ncbi:MAG: ComEC/Rec2 family competence protein, partial [Sandaracinobacteroides sp.]
AGFALSGLPRRLLMGLGLLAALGLVAADLRSASVAQPRLHHRLAPASVAGTLLEVRPHEGGARHSLLIRRDATAIDPPVVVRISTNRLPSGAVPGARIAVDASLGPVSGPAIPGAHDPARRAWFEGVSATGRATGPLRLLARSPADDSPLAQARQRLTAWISASLGGDAGAIASALVAGEQGLVRPGLLADMRTAGLAHILTVSGFHIGVVVAGVLFALRRLLALWPALALRTSVTRIAAIGAGLAGTGYAVLSGGDLPAIRAAIAAWVVLLALVLGRDPLSPRLIAFAAFLILLVRPEALVNPSFQLSFAAVTALVALARSGLGQWLAPKAAEGLLPAFARFAAALVVTGLVAELVLTPIVLMHFGRAGTYGLIANVAAVPLTGFVVMPLLGAWLLLSVIGAGGLVAWALRPALEALGAIGTIVAGWPGSSFALSAMPMSAMLLFVAGGLLLALLAGRLRWAGVPLIAAAAVLALLAPRPDLFIGADGRQVGVIANGTLHTLRGHRQGFVVHNWSERAAAAPTARIADLPGASCTPQGCTVRLSGGHSLLALSDEPGPIDCGSADIVTAPRVLPRACTPRWLKLDLAALRLSGAVSIQSTEGRIDSIAGRSGDQPWSPAALPGTRPRLLGPPAWTGVIAE